MSQYKPYLKYKDSGIEWIGQMPEHWEVKPFFALVTELSRKNIGLVESNILSLSYGNIIQRPETRNLGLTPESYETYQIVEPDEIVFRFTDLQNDKRSLRSAMVTQKGIITSAYMAVKTHGVNSSYFAWMMRSYDLCKVFYAMGGGLRQSLRFEDVKRLLVLVPPYIEQRDIANAINAETARIDALIEKKTRFIELLKEKRQALITHAVTKGLDPNAKMKDSGVEWIGQVPEHWEVISIKFLAHCSSGQGINSLEVLDIADDKNSFPVIGGNGMMGWTSKSNYKEPVLSIGRVGALCGNVHLINYPSWISDNSLILKVYSKKVNLEILQYILLSRNLNNLASKSAQPLITGTQVKNEKITLPPPEEQATIAATLDRETARIDALIGKAEQSITLLKERRSAFITAAVTGQIDLRGEH